jgi:hypothetical protein
MAWLGSLSTEPVVGENENENPTWGDYGRTGLAGAKELGSSIGAGTRYLGEGGEQGQAIAEFGKYLQSYFSDSAEETISELTPAARKRLEAAVTSEDFWAHPASAVALKSTRMAPSVVAAVIPAALTSGAFTAGAVAAGASGALSAAQTIDDIYKITDDLPDDQLQRESTYYAGLRSAGIEEAEARRDYNQKLMGVKPALIMALGAATGAFGPAASIARGLKGGSGALTGAAGSGLAGRVGRGAGEGAASEFIEEGAQEGAEQHAAVSGGHAAGYDAQKFIDASLEGALLGGVMGGAAAAPSGGRGVSARPAPRASERVEVVEPIAPSAEQQAGLAASAAPTPAPEPVVPAAPVSTPADIPPVSTPADMGVNPQAAAAPPNVNPEVAPSTVPAADVTAPVVEAPPAPVTPKVTPSAGPAVWANKDYDIPVNVLPDPPQAGEDGRQYQRVERDGVESFVPVDELRPAKKAAARPKAAPEVAPGPPPRRSPRHPPNAEEPARPAGPHPGPCAGTGCREG